MTIRYRECWHILYHMLWRALIAGTLLSDTNTLLPIKSTTHEDIRWGIRVSYQPTICRFPNLGPKSILCTSTCLSIGSSSNRANFSNGNNGGKWGMYEIHRNTSKSHISIVSFISIMIALGHSVFTKNGENDTGKYRCDMKKYILFL